MGHIIFLSFENRCECKGCPDKIYHAIMSFCGVKEVRNMDYKKGTAELVANAEVAGNPKSLCEWIHKKANKSAKVTNISSRSLEMHVDIENYSEERIIYAELKEVEIRRTSIGWNRRS